MSLQQVMHRKYYLVVKVKSNPQRLDQKATGTLAMNVVPGLPHERQQQLRSIN